MSRIPLGLVVLILVFASSIHAQVILSYEGLDRNAVDGLFVPIELSLDGGVGNAEYLDWSVTPGFSYRFPAPGQWVRFYPSIRVRSSDNKSLVREWSAHLRHSYVFSEEMRTYTFIQFQADRSIDLDRRFLFGGGVRPRIMKMEDGGLDIGFGLMLEDEVLTSGETGTEPEDEVVMSEETGTELRGANLISAHGKAGMVQILATGFYQPVMSNPKDYRVSVNTEADIPVSDYGSLVVFANWRRDSRPPTGIESYDVRFGFSIRLVFSNTSR